MSRNRVSRVYWNSCLFHVAFQDTCSSQVYIWWDKIVAAFLSFSFFLFGSTQFWIRSDFFRMTSRAILQLDNGESVGEFSGVTIRAVVRLFLSFICPLKIDVRFTMADNSSDSTFCLWCSSRATAQLWKRSFFLTLIKSSHNLHNFKILYNCYNSRREISNFAFFPIFIIYIYIYICISRNFT